MNRSFDDAHQELAFTPILPKIQKHSSCRFEFRFDSSLAFWNSLSHGIFFYIHDPLTTAMPSSNDRRVSRGKVVARGTSCERPTTGRHCRRHSCREGSCSDIVHPCEDTPVIRSKVSNVSDDGRFSDSRNQQSTP